MGSKGPWYQLLSVKLFLIAWLKLYPGKVTCQLWPAPFQVVESTQSVCRSCLLIRPGVYSCNLFKEGCNKNFFCAVTLGCGFPCEALLSFIFMLQCLSPLPRAVIAPGGLTAQWEVLHPWQVTSPSAELDLWLSSSLTLSASSFVFLFYFFS